MRFNGLKRYFQICKKDDIIVEMAAIEKPLIVFVDFKNLRKREVPRLELCTFAQSIKNVCTGSNNDSKHSKDSSDQEKDCDTRHNTQKSKSPAIADYMLTITGVVLGIL